MSQIQHDKALLGKLCPKIRKQTPIAKGAVKDLIIFHTHQKISHGMGNTIFRKIVNNNHLIRFSPDELTRHYEEIIANLEELQRMRTPWPFYLDTEGGYETLQNGTNVALISIFNARDHEALELFEAFELDDFTGGIFK
ncbi:hypothetical protein GCK72_015762 [Caenorhabditis remanei]|uniref:Uncharacterized protein n=1 Tax=Caenorhabditis remanei TaxID=31234 RepID=A0A6A5GUZ7_CAERE|nr:hypothetical protein GCK72_015762 [Caenorhabditis remanei]KAF1759298.1 hypothetical protein GCK72_015762 [Caenorhabditis remanei]